MQIPLRRQIRTVETSSVPACAVGVFGISAHAEAMRFSDAIYIGGTHVVVAAKKSALRPSYASIEDLLQQPDIGTMGLMDHIFYGETLNRIIRASSVSKARFSTNVPQTLTILVRGRFDFVLLDSEEAMYFIEKMNLGEKLRVVKFDTLTPREPHYLRCTDGLSEHTLRKINLGLATTGQ